MLFGGYLLTEEGTGHQEELELGQSREGCHLGLGGAQSQCKAADSPLCSEVHELRRETVSRELGRWLFHHLLQLLERSPPGFIRKP